MDQAITAQADQAPAVTSERFSFTGTSGEYFRIWIVNTSLTLLTLGIYSPWAKVRRNKYLYRHSHLAGESFDYHANPVAILKGRLIAFAMVVAYFITTFFAPALSILIALLIAAMVPWLLVRSRMFAMRYTGYRNVRFGFRPVYRESYKVFLKYGLITLITLGMGYAWLQAARARLIVDNTRYGTLGMKLGEQVRGSSFLGVYFAGSLLFGLALVMVTFGAGFISNALAQADTPPAPDFGAFQLTGIMTSVLLYVLFYYGVNAAIQRLVLNGVAVGGNPLVCDWTLAGYLWIVFTNLIAILLSAGLLIPWASIRVQRFKLEHIAVQMQTGDLASVAAAGSGEVSALGDEIGEAFDYDFGF